MPFVLSPDLTGSPWFSNLVLPALIFFARTLDMTLSTMRITFIAQGRTFLAPFFGFFESFIWLLIIGQVLQHLNNPLCAFAYAGGFAAGNSVGLYLERRLAVGNQVIRIITTGSAVGLASALRNAGVGVTVVDGEGSEGPVKILFSLVRRRDVKSMLALVRGQDPSAFYSIADVRQAVDRVYPALRAGSASPWSRILRRSQRKAK